MSTLPELVDYLKQNAKNLSLAEEFVQRLSPNVELDKLILPGMFLNMSIDRKVELWLGQSTVLAVWINPHLGVENGDIVINLTQIQKLELFKFKHVPAEADTCNYYAVVLAKNKENPMHCANHAVTQLILESNAAEVFDQNLTFNTLKTKPNNFVQKEVVVEKTLNYIKNMQQSISLNPRILYVATYQGQFSKNLTGRSFATTLFCVDLYSKMTKPLELDVWGIDHTQTRVLSKEFSQEGEIVNLNKLGSWRITYPNEIEINHILNIYENKSNLVFELVRLNASKFEIIFAEKLNKLEKEFNEFIHILASTMCENVEVCISP